jgi:nitrite reductase (NADH) small subunit
MTQQWKMICKLKDIGLPGVRLVQRGLAWQELPGVAVFRTSEDRLYALLDSCAGQRGVVAQGTLMGQCLTCVPQGSIQGWQVDLATGTVLVAGQPGIRTYTVKLEEGRIYLDLNELNAPASRAEAALAGAFSVAAYNVTA